MGLNNRDKRALAYLYDFRNTPSDPPDRRTSLGGIAEVFELRIDGALRMIEKLEERAYVRSWKVGRLKFCKITPYGIAELEKQTERWFKGEIGTSGIGLETGKRVIVG